MCNGASAEQCHPVHLPTLRDVRRAVGTAKSTGKQSTLIYNDLAWPIERGAAEDEEETGELVVSAGGECKFE